MFNRQCSKLQGYFLKFDLLIREAGRQATLPTRKPGG
jgi:hypothetical protein